MTKRRVVGYIRSITKASYEWQKRKIKEYCNLNNITLNQIFADTKNNIRNERRKKEFIRTQQLGINTKKWTHVYEAWEHLMLQSSEGTIAYILVDSKLRLYDGQVQREILNKICTTYKIKIIEVGDFEFPIENSLSKKLVFYHYCIEPNKRTRITLNEIDHLIEYASQHNGWEASAFYLDFDTSKTQLKKLLENSRCNVVLVKDFFHLHRTTTGLFNIVQSLRKEENKIISMKEEKLKFIEDNKQLLLSPLKVSIYDKHRSNFEEEYSQLEKDRLEIFAKTHTNWIIENIYIDTLKDKNFPQLDELISKSKDYTYNLILISSFSKLGDSTTEFFKIIKRINIPIYSLKEGGIIFEK